MYSMIKMIAMAGLGAVLLSSTTAALPADPHQPAPQSTRLSHAEILEGTDSLLQYFNQTTADLEKQVAGLSEAQLQFKPAPDKWSISQCLEHIVLSERMIFNMAKSALEKAPQPERKSEVKMTDDHLKTSYRSAQPYQRLSQWCGRWVSGAYVYSSPLCAAYQTN